VSVPVSRPRLVVVRAGLAAALVLALAACHQPPAPVLDKSGIGADGLPAPEVKPGVVVVTGPSAPPVGTVVVERGDTLFDIARAQRVPLRDLIELNRLNPPYVLLVGQVLMLPGQRDHVVEKGDTVYAIARRYDVDMSRLVRLNGIEPPYTLYVGDRLILPASGGGGGTVLASSGATASGPVSSEPLDSPAPEPTVTSGAASPEPVPLPAEIVVTPPSAAGFSWPAQGKIVSGFGPKPGNLHNDGINIALPRGVPVLAVRDGTVAYVGNELKGYGNLVLIRHDSGWVSAYAHNDALLVTRGQAVRRGDVVAQSGATGNVASPQLHFELRRQGEAVDPVRFLGG
jgi:murein DD-endopeptidase MepM/ murein hydrolase activator NlpD